MDPKACCPLLLRHEVVLANFGLVLSAGDCPPPGSSDEHAGLSHGAFHPGRFAAVVFILLGLQMGGRVLMYYAAACFENKKMRSPIGSLFGKLVWDTYVMCLLALATLAAGVTFQAALSPPAGIYPDPQREKISYQVRNKHKKLPLSKQEGNKQRLAEDRTVENQMYSLRLEIAQREYEVSRPLDADTTVRWCHVAHILAHTWYGRTLVLGHCVVFYLIIEVVYFYYLLHHDVRGRWKRSAYMVGISLLCTLQNLYEAGGIPPKAQVGVSRDSEYISTGSYGESEPENSSGSGSRVAKNGGIKDVAKTADTWLVASAATHHATGNRNLLSGFKTVYDDDLYIQAGDGVPMPVRGRGSVITDTVVLPDVSFVPGLAGNIVSASQLTELDYSVGFTHGVCYIRAATDGTVIGKAPVGEDGMFQLEFLKLPLLH